MIYSALYYMGSLDDPRSLVRDNRFYPGKAASTFAVWWQYVRKHYPDEKVILFADESSPVPIRPLLRTLKESWEEIGPDGNGIIHDSGSGFDETDPLVTVYWTNRFAGEYFRPMQRNLVEAISMAYNRNEDCFWLDNDAFLNTDIRPLVAGYDVAASGMGAHQMTMDSVCTYVSAARLHAYDGLCRLPDYLRAMVNDGPTETRMHSLQEGGLYKLFCYGKTRALGPHIDLAHLSCYSSFMRFLRGNPLDTPEYRSLLNALESFDMTRLNGVDMTFHDMLYLTKDGGPYEG